MIGDWIDKHPLAAHLAALAFMTSVLTYVVLA